MTDRPTFDDGSPPAPRAYSAHRKPVADAEGFVLVGGASRRMGRDKCSLTIGGVTLAGRALAALGSATGRARFVAKPGAAPAARGRAEVVADVYRAADGSAPQSALTGLHAALWHARAGWVVVLACDLPFATGELIRTLAARRHAAGSPHDAEAIVPVQPDGRRQPLCAFYRRMPALRRATEQLDANDHSLGSFLERLRVREVPAAELAGLPGAERFFLNLNTPEDFAGVERAPEE